MTKLTDLTKAQLAEENERLQQLLIQKEKELNDAQDALKAQLGGTMQEGYLVLTPNPVTTVTSGVRIYAGRAFLPIVRPPKGARPTLAPMTKEESNEQYMARKDKFHAALQEWEGYDAQQQLLRTLVADFGYDVRELKASDLAQLREDPLAAEQVGLSLAEVLG